MAPPGGDEGDPLAKGWERPASPGRGAGGIVDRLLESGHRFDFFQAVRLIQIIWPDRVRVGLDGPPRAEAVRFRAHQSLGFPASAVFEIDDREERLPPLNPGAEQAGGVGPLVLTQNFLGLTGPSGALPVHYSEMLLQLPRPSRAAGAGDPLLDWFDLFNHRLTSLFYRAWEKYRAFPHVERGETTAREPDTFTNAVFCVLGLGSPTLRDRVGEPVRREPPRAALPAPTPAPETGTGAGPRVRFDDLTLLYFSGLLAQRPANAVSLKRLVESLTGVPAEVREFQGQWVRLDDSQRTRIGWSDDGNNRLGFNATAGARIWDVQGQFRIILGPMPYDQFVGYIPREREGSDFGSRSALAKFFNLVRLYVGADLDSDVQFILPGPEVPQCRLDSDDPVGPRLGWNTWIFNDAFKDNVDDATFRDDFARTY